MPNFTQVGSPLVAPDAAKYHNYGRAVALSRNGLVMAVGAPYAVTKGQVYVYDLVAGAWSLRGILTPPGLWDYEFGIGVALDGDGSTLAISGTSFGDYGGVYVYDWSGSAWVKRAQMVVPATEDISSFGWSVALSTDGTILAAGCQWDYTQGSTGSSVWLFDWDGDEWVERGSLYNGSALSYGIGVALNGDGTVLAVGEEKNNSRGAVWIYDWSGSAWVQRGSILTPADLAYQDYFGGSVALNSAGNLLAVGATYWEGTLSNQGGVYLFTANGTGWDQDGNVLVASDAAGGDGFGSGVALSGGGLALMIGAYTAEVGSLTSQGQAYYFTAPLVFEVNLGGTLGGLTAAVSAWNVPDVAASMSATLGDIQGAITLERVALPTAGHAAIWSLGVAASHGAVWSIPLKPPVHTLAWQDYTVSRRAVTAGWADCAVVAGDLAAPWADRATGRASLTSGWADCAVARALSAASWADRAAALAMSQAEWADCLPSGAALTSPWADRARARHDCAAGWSDAVAVGPQDLALSWGDRAAGRGTLAATWAGLSMGRAEASSSWADCTVTRSLATAAWSNRADASAMSQAPWADCPAASADLILPWENRARAVREFETGWGAAVPVGPQDLALSWGDRAAGRGTVAATWADALPATQDCRHLWQEAVAARGQSQAAWSSCPAARLTHAAVYADQTAARKAHGSAWAGRVAVRSSHGGTWYLTAIGRQSNTLSWALRERPQAASVHQARWAVLENVNLLSISNVPEVIWNGRSLALHGARLSLDEDSPVWIAEEILLADAVAWGQIALGDTLQFRVLEETWTLRVDGKGLSRPHVGELTLSLSAVSPLAWLDAPYAAAITLDNSEGAVSARATVAALVADVGLVRWELDDWLIPSGALAMSETTPLKAARTIVAAIGGLLESDPDGTPVARWRHPVSVPDYAVATPDHVIQDADLFAFQVSAAPLAGFNRVVISNEDLSGTDVTDRLEYLDEDLDPYEGEMRAWPNPWRPVTLGHTGHPDTEIEALGARAHSQTERVEFVAGRGQVKYPVQAITSLTWQHADLGSVVAQGSDLIAATAGQSLAWVTYTSLSLDWRVALARDEAVQFVLI